MARRDKAQSEIASRRHRARRGEGERLRDEILDAGERLLLETGSASAVSIRAIANEVGVTAPSIYRHFSDKASLIYSICERHFEEMHAHIVEAVEGIDDPIAAIEACGRAYVEFGVANPEPYRVMFMTRPDLVPDEMQRVWYEESPTIAMAVELAQRCIETGRLHPQWTDPAEVALGLWVRVHGVTSMIISKPFLELDRPEFLASYLNSCLTGVVAETDG